MRKPNIALINSKEENMITTNQDYLDSIWFAGGIPTVLPYTSDINRINEFAEYFDGFLFCGGGDIDPKYYNEENSGESKNICSARDAFEYAMLRKIYELNKPILGICRGLQMLNVFLGGSLNQNIPDHSQSAKRSTHEQRVSVIKSSPLFEIVQKETIFTNSFHHQSIKSLGKSLNIDAIADDGCIEAVHSLDHRYCFGVQWHPENFYTLDESSRAIFTSFINACISAK